MAAYKVFFKKSAAGELERIPRKDLPRFVERIRGLGENPRPEGCQKLSAQERYRIRQGDYRIVYSISDREREVRIVKIGRQSEVYRRE
jgi:mRNA interferase RelE/StbE